MQKESRQHYLTSTQSPPAGLHISNAAKQQRPFERPSAPRQRKTIASGGRPFKPSASPHGALFVIHHYASTIFSGAARDSAPHSTCGDTRSDEFRLQRSRAGQHTLQPQRTRGPLRREQHHRRRHLENQPDLHHRPVPAAEEAIQARGEVPVPQWDERSVTFTSSNPPNMYMR